MTQPDPTDAPNDAQAKLQSSAKALHDALFKASSRLQAVQLTSDAFFLGVANLMSAQLVASGDIPREEQNAAAASFYCGMLIQTENLWDLDRAFQEAKKNASEQSS